MMRRASIPGARPRPLPRRPSRASCTASSSARRSRGQAKRVAGRRRRQPLVRVVLGAQPHRGIGGARRRRTPAPARPRRPGADRTSRPGSGCTAARARARSPPPARAAPPPTAARRPRCGRAPSPTSPDSGRPARTPQHQALEPALALPQHVHVHQRHPNRGHGFHRAKASSSSMPGPLRLLGVELGADHRCRSRPASGTRAPYSPVPSTASSGRSLGW